MFFYTVYSLHSVNMSSPKVSDNPPQLVRPDDKDIKVYKRRFLVCIAFGINSIINQMLWITFAPIQSKASEYYGVSQNAINIYSLIFMICYVPGTIFCATMFKSLGLRKSFCIATFLQLIGAGLRYLGTLSIIGNENDESYVVVLIGQTLAAIVQPFFTNSPSRIAAEWFSVDGRDIATALLSILGSLGIGVGNIMPTIFVQSDGTQYGGFEGLMLTELILCGVGLLAMIIFFYDQPPTAPSISQKLKLGANNQQSVSRDFKNLICNINFMCLLLGFGIGLGVFNALATLINQYTALFGYDTDDAGIFGASLIGGGLLGAFVGGGIMETLRKYNTIIKVYTVLNSITISCLLYALLPNNFVIVTILFGVLGFMAVPIIAVAFEAGAECSYPIGI